MAITKLVSPSTPNPTGTGAGASWDLAMAQLTAVKKILSGEQMLLTQWTNTSTMPKLALGIYLQHLGAIYVVASADYTIPTPSSDGTYYVKLTVSGETLTVSVVNSLSGFAWSSQHNGLYNASNEQILPYQIVRGGAGTTFEKRKILNLANATNAFTTINYLGKVYGSELAVTGALSVGGTISGATVNTGQGANKLYPMNQDVRTIARVTFDTVNAKSFNTSVSSYWSEIGTALSLPTVTGRIALCSLSSTLVAFVDETTKTLRTYQWSGSTWSQIGASLSIPGIDTPSMGALSSDTVALLDFGTYTLRTYQWAGNSWSQIGASLSATGYICALSPNTVSCVDQGTDTLRTYQWSGSTWSQIGAIFSLTPTTFVTQCALQSNMLVIGENNTGYFSLFRWSGSAWRRLDIDGTFPVNASPAMCAMSYDVMAFHDTSTDSLRTYRLYNNAWEQEGTALNIGDTGSTAITALGTDTIAVFCRGSAPQLRVYRLTFLGLPPNPAFGTL